MSLQQLYVALLAAGLVVLVSIVATRVASRVGLPSLLLFLALGVVLGEDVLGIEFNDAQLAQNLGTAALAVILIEGGLTTRWSDIRSVVAPAGVLASAGVGVSTRSPPSARTTWSTSGWQQALLHRGDRRLHRCGGGLFHPARAPAAAAGRRPAGGGVRLQRRAQRHPRAAVQLDAVSPLAADVHRPAALRARCRRRDRPGCGLAWRGRAAPDRVARLWAVPARDLRAGHRRVCRRRRRARQRFPCRLPRRADPGQRRAATPSRDAVLRRRARLARPDRIVHTARAARHPAPAAS